MLELFLHPTFQNKMAHLEKMCVNNSTPCPRQGKNHTQKFFFFLSAVIKRNKFPLALKAFSAAPHVQVSF